MTGLSIIIPCYNEEESLPLLKTHLDKLIARNVFDLQLIFVDDGSTDNTNKIINATFSKYPGFKLVTNEINKNLGGAVKAGIPFCKRPFTAVIDSDCSYDPIHLIEMKQALEGFDVVSASAHHPDAGFAAHTPFYRVFLSKSVVMMYNILLFKYQYSYTSIFRLYHTSDLKALTIHHNGFMAMTEIMIKLLIQKKRIKEFPAKSNFRQFGVSKAKIFRIIKSHLVFMSKLILYRLTGITRHL